MAAVKPAPLDQETGLPLPVVGDRTLYSEATNYHHPWFPRRSEELLYDFPYVTELTTEQLSLSELGGFAVRMSYGQKLPIEQHVDFHREYAGPVLPSTVSEKFRAAIQGCSGVIPRTALVVGGSGDGDMVRLDEWAYEQLDIKPEHHYHWRHKELRRGIMGDFFVRYALMQDLKGAPDKMVDRFLNATDDAKRKELGNFLLKEVLDASVAPVRPWHAELKKRGMVRLGAPNVLRAVRKQLVPHRVPLYRDYLADRLATA